MKSYINVYPISRDKLVHSYIEDGVRKQDTEEFKPICGYIAPLDSQWSDIYGNALTTIRFPSMSACSDWKSEKENVFDVYGDIQYPLAFITENYTGEITTQKEQMNIYALDIECYSESGKFCKAENDGDYINAITFYNMVTDKYYVMGLKDYTPTRKNVKYWKYDNEAGLLKAIIGFFNTQQIDIISGWYLPFDIPYIIDRIEKILGKNKSHALSPCGKIYKGNKTVNKRQVDVYDIIGITNLDYLDLYQKFTYDNKDSYTLDNIVKHELGESKLDYKTSDGNLNDLYANNPQLFYDYNVRDVELIKLLDDKLKFIDIAINYAYMMKCNLGDIFGTVKPWDAFLYNELYYQNKLCSPNKNTSAVDFVGGYVKEPTRGLIEWVTVFDIVSSYPNQISSSNLSPETLVPESYIRANPDLVEIRKNFYGAESCIDIDKLETITATLKKHKLCFTPNGQFFYTTQQGFISDVVTRVFQKRVDIKKQIKLATTKHEKELLESKSQIIKIAINSCYGAVGCNYFRYYDTRISEAVTMQGQLCARGVATYIEKKFPAITWIYQDTDSCFFDLNKIISSRFGDTKPDNKTILDFLLKYQDKILQPAINEYFHRLGAALNVKKMTIEMEHETIADKSIFVEKKMYIMHQVYKDGKNLIDKPKYKIKGLAVIKTAAYPAYTRKVMRDVIESIIEQNDNQAVRDIINNFKKEFYTAEPNQISTPTSVTMEGNRTDKATGKKFKINLSLRSSGLPKQVRAAFVYNNALEKLGLTDKYQSIKDGNKIRYIGIKMPNIFENSVMGCLEKIPPEISAHIEIDYDSQWESTFKKPITAVMDAVGFTMEPKLSLDSFFD